MGFQQLSLWPLQKLGHLTKAQTSCPQRLWLSKCLGHSKMLFPPGPEDSPPTSHNGQGTNTLLVIVTAGEDDKKPNTKLAVQAWGRRWWVGSGRGGLQTSSHPAGCLKGKMEGSGERLTPGTARAPSLFCLVGIPQMPTRTCKSPCSVRESGLNRDR